MKSALIAIAKTEQLYIKEWLCHHLDIGFNTIIIADNDDELILSGYASDRVIIEDYTNVVGVQPLAYTELFNKYRKDFDWIFFCDIDEFLVIEDGRDVNTFLSSYPQDVDSIRLNCKHFTDNDELDVIDGNYNVFDRFKTPIAVENDRFAKSFINTRIDYMGKIYGHGIYADEINAIDVEGNKCSNKKKLDSVIHRIAWVNHYRTKTIGEYIRQKYNRGGPNKNPWRYSEWKIYFFVTNKKTLEKIEYANKIIKEIPE